jgi:site-specific DNA recombinase
MESPQSAAQGFRRPDDWTRESEAAALAALRRAAAGDGPKPAILAYARQSKSDFDKDGNPKGPSIDQQFESIESRPEFQGLPIERYYDADRTGGETSRRSDYQRLRQRIRDAAPGEIGAVAFYYDHRFNRNDIEHFQFMADMEERRILVFDKEGLVFNADKVSWKVKAIIAQAERERIARTVRDNLAYLKRHGHMLGVIPQGYMRVDGSVVEDPEAAPVVRQIFALYATGKFSFEGVADHLNRQGIKPKRGPKKDNHRRPQAVIFTGDVVKDIIKNRAYLGQVRVGRWRSEDEQWIEGKHPALVDEPTWEACQAVRTRNRRRTSNHWTKHSYVLTPILRCGLCGAPMHGDAVVKEGHTYLYYRCLAKKRSAAHPPTTRCAARRIPAPRIEDAIRGDLRLIVPNTDLDAGVRDLIGAALEDVSDPLKTVEAAIRRLDDQRDRARRLFEFGEYTWDEFMAKRDAINAEKKRLEEERDRPQQPGAMEWCRAQVADLLKAWDDGNGAQRARLLCAIFERIEAVVEKGGGLSTIAVPRADWRPFFQSWALERETGDSRAATTCSEAVQFGYRFVG